MARDRPAIERRTPVAQTAVIRTARHGKRTTAWVFALAVTALLIYFSTNKLAGIVKAIDFPSAFDSLITQITGARPTTSPPVPERKASALDTLHAAIRAADPGRVEAALNELPRDEINLTVNGMTALMLAASTGNPTIVRVLLARGANPNARGTRQRTALQYATERNRRQAALLLLDAGADINGADDGSLTPLIMAADRNYTELALVLIERGANVNIQNIEGWTALMDAAEVGNARLVQALITAGAHRKARHNNGSTALDFAKAGNHAHIIQMLSGQGVVVPAHTGQDTLPRPAASNSPIRQSLPAKKGQRQ